MVKVKSCTVQSGHKLKFRLMAPLPAASIDPKLVESDDGGKSANNGSAHLDPRHISAFQIEPVKPETLRSPDSRIIKF